MFDSYDLYLHTDSLFDRDLARLGSLFFYYVVARHAFLFYTKFLVSWFIRLGFFFYKRVLCFFNRYFTLAHLHPQRSTLARQGCRIRSTTPYGFIHLLEPCFRLLSLGFTTLASHLPGLYEDAAFYDIRGVGGGRVPKQLPGASDYQRYRDFEPHHIRDMCFGYYELPWGENY